MVRWKLVVSCGKAQVIGPATVTSGDGDAVGEAVAVGEGVAVGEAVAAGEAVAPGVPVSLTPAVALAAAVSSSALSVTPQAVDSITPKSRARAASRVLMIALQ